MTYRKSKNDDWRTYPDEASATNAAVTILSQHFEVWTQVHAHSLDKSSAYRLDAVSYCSKTDFLLGWEFKKSHLFMAEFSDGLRQAINSRDSVITDSRLGVLQQRQVNGCVLFPDWDGLHDDGTVRYGSEAVGMRHLAQHFRVGTLAIGSRRDTESIVIGQSAVWHSKGGWTGNAEGVLRGARKRGSQKQRDRVMADFDGFFDRPGIDIERGEQGAYEEREAF